VASSESARRRIGDFYVEDVLPALAARLDAAFPEFGWKRDTRGWVATNQEMTHGAFGARAERVVAHGAAPPGFLIHGGDPILWTAYLNGGVVPRGERFRVIVEELAARAGVDVGPVGRMQPRDRKSELLDEFFALCQAELKTDAAVKARSYLESRGLPGSAVDHVGLGVVPEVLITKNALEKAGYSELEIVESGVIADGRWPGRLCGAWRDERGRIGTLWARSLRDSDSSTRYLYLRGASRAGLPLYGVSELREFAPADRREVVVVEGLLDVHHLRVAGFPSVVAVGGARVQAEALRRLRRVGVDSLVLAFDNDAPGREGIARAIDSITRTGHGPECRVLEPARLGDSKDPDEFVRKHGAMGLRDLVAEADCAIVWQAQELIGGITTRSANRERRAAVARAGEWLGSLSARYALEQEDAVRVVAQQTGYSKEALERAFRARFWRKPSSERSQRPQPGIER
jgi:DNA primase